MSPDALALVRFGLRAADDPRILEHGSKSSTRCSTTEMPHGPCWHRYNGDGYGEHRDGARRSTAPESAGPRALLTLERARYEPLSRAPRGTERALDTSRSFASAVGLLPEQIWDAPDFAERDTCFGKPSGPPCRSVWAHAEYVKLCRSRRDGRVFDLPPQTVKRYSRRSPRVATRGLAVQSPRPFHRSRRESARSKSWRRPSFIGARMAGAPSETSQRAMSA